MEFTGDSKIADVLKDVVPPQQPDLTPPPAPMEFEGPEKTLEVEFVPNVGIKSTGLRSLTRSQINRLLNLAQCSILSRLSNECMDSYVLSESSLFVYKHKLLIKTCGTTTVLRLLPDLLEMTKSLGMELSWLGYYRKNFSFPLQQIFPHRSFAEEVTYLQETCMLPGEGHSLGNVEGDHFNVFFHDKRLLSGEECEERLLSIMMYGIDKKVSEIFWKSKSDHPRTASGHSSSSGGHSTSSDQKIISPT